MNIFLSIIPENLFPENISTYGQEIDSLFYMILAAVTLAFVITLFFLLYPIVGFRSGNGRKATYLVGKGKELRWVIIAMVLLGITDFYILAVEHSTWAKIEETLPEADVRMGVIGRQWNWIFTYPGKDNILNTEDDVTVDMQNSEMHIPVNKNIVVELKAKDVLHNFSLPNVRFKQDVLPGRTITRWFNITKTGIFEIQCAEICGVLHSGMRNFLVVESEEDYKKYLEELYNK